SDLQVCPLVAESAGHLRTTRLAGFYLPGIPRPGIPLLAMPVHVALASLLILLRHPRPGYGDDYAPHVARFLLRHRRQRRQQHENNTDNDSKSSQAPHGLASQAGRYLDVGYLAGRNRPGEWCVRDRHFRPPMERLRRVGGEIRQGRPRGRGREPVAFHWWRNQWLLDLPRRGQPAVRQQRTPED